MLGRLGSAFRWPVTLREDSGALPPGGTLLLRPLARRDEADWYELRRMNALWLAPWEATDPGLDDTWWRRGAGVGTSVPSAVLPIPPMPFREYVAELRRSARRGDALPFAVELDGELVGQITVSAISLGSQRGGSIGYWVSRHVAGRGVIPTALAMVIDHCLDECALHRLEVCIRPENVASLRVVGKLSLREEGLRERFIHIGGQWCDHLVFAVTREEVQGPGGMMRRWRGVVR